MVIACADWRSEPRAKPTAVTPPPVTTVVKTELASMAPVRDECFTTDTTDTTETAAMKCADGAASRIADTLQILLSSGRVLRRVDRSLDSESMRTYRYAGRIGGSSGAPALHVLDGHSNDALWAEMINALTGDSLVVASRPLISPDGARFSVDAMSLEGCEGTTVLQVWRITGDKPVRELGVEPFDCTTNRGWGPSAVEWRSSDSISYLRNSLPRDSARRANHERDTTRALLVRRSGEWVLVPKP
jgi:hypothetical protein